MPAPVTAFVWLGAVPDFTVGAPANGTRSPRYADLDGLMAAIFGPPTPAERAAIDRILGGGA